MKFFIIAGEASGDMHAANLMKEIRKQNPAAVFRGFGGDKMKEEGLEVLVHYKEIAVMGFSAVLANLRKISRILSLCKEELLNWNPDAVILVDYPGFNLRMAEFANKKGFKVIYYILPKIWAWNEKRGHKLIKSTGLLVSILAFEKEYYLRKWKTEPWYAGHPLVDELNKFTPDPDFRKKNGLEGKKVIAVMPGSRKHEISKNLPIILSTLPDFPDYHYVIAASSQIPAALYKKYLGSEKTSVIFDSTYDILKISEAGIIKSGTSTLEAALFRLPILVCYRMTFMTAFLSWILVKIRFVSLPNLIAGKEIVKELIQYRFTKETTSAELSKILTDTNYREKMLSDFDDLIILTGKESPSAQAALKILEYTAG